MHSINIKSAILTFVFFLFVFCSSVASAATTYQTTQPLQQNTISFPIVGTGDLATSTPNYIFVYRLPIGITFDRFVISVPSSQDVDMPVLPPSLGNITVGEEPWNCPNQQCFNNEYNNIVDLVTVSKTKPTDTTIQLRFASSTLVTSTNRDLYFYVSDPNPYISASFAFNGTQQPQSAALNGGNWSRSTVVPALKFCDGNCDDFDFSPIPELTSSPWIRLTSPQPSSVISPNTPFSVQFNTGTTTVDNVQVLFSSNFQSITPYEYSITQTGLGSFTFGSNFPAIDDNVGVIINLRNGTTTVVTSPDYFFQVSLDDTVPAVTEETIQYCDSVSGLSWAVCRIVAFLFAPSNASVDQFSMAVSELNAKAPFVYVSQMSTLVTSLYSSPQLASSTISVDFVGQDLQLISVSQINAIPFVSFMRTMFGYIFWVMFLYLIYNRTLRMFNPESV